MAIRIRSIILEMMARHLPDFFETSTKRQGYWFHCDRDRPYHEFVVISSSQKGRALGCDVAWGFFPTWNGAYGTHQMTASTSLPCLRLGSTVIPMEQGYYEHDGTEAGIRGTLNRIGCELADYALPWFRARAAEAGNDRLLQHGLDWLRVHEPSIPATIQDDLQQALVQASYIVGRVKLPVLDALKIELRIYADKIGASTLQRKEITILAHHLLQYAGEIKRNSPP
jgi:hypothetical protein